MVLCFAPGCSHDQRQGCKMFAVPRDPEDFKKWKNLLSCRTDRVLANTSRVCSCHFVEGDKKNGPTIFAHNLKKRLTFHSPEKNKRSKPSTKDSNVTSSAPSTSQQSTINLDGKTMDELMKEIVFLRNNVKSLEEQVTKLETEKFFSYEQIKNNNKLIALYTGLPDHQTFDSLLKYLLTFDFNYFYGWKVTRISEADQLLLTLMKLRLNLPHLDLATRFGCSITTVTNTFYTYLYLLHETLHKTFMKKIPSQRKTKTCLPSVFSSYTNCRLILDCTELRIHRPNSIKQQKESYSNYKHANTFKALVGVAPNGVVVFASDLYPGSVSDKKIYEASKINDQLKPGDMLMVDKGFLIKDLVPAGVHVNMPPFLMNRRFTREEAIETMNIARCRIHVERANARIKAFRILNLIPGSLKKHATVVFQVCCNLVNLQNPLLKEIEGLLDPEN